MRPRRRILRGQLEQSSTGVDVRKLLLLWRVKLSALGFQRSAFVGGFIFIRRLLSFHLEGVVSRLKIILGWLLQGICFF